MGVFKTIGRFVVVPAYPSRIVLRMKYNQTCFAAVLMHLFHKTIYMHSPQSVLGCIHQGFIQLISHPLCLWTSFIVTEISFSPFVVDLSLNPFWKFLRLGNLAWDFFRVNFWSRDWVVLKALGIFLVLIFTLIRSSLSLKIRSTPPPCVYIQAV